MSNRCPFSQFDHHSRDFSQNRSVILKEMRESEPLTWTESHGGYWVVTSYELAKKVLDNPEIFSSEKKADGTGGVTIPSVGPRLLPAEVDPPFHSQLRRAMSSAYSPKAIKAMEPLVEEIVQQTVDRLIDKQEFDIVEDVSEVVPPLVGLRHLGFPESRRKEMVAFIKIALSPMATLEEMGTAFQSACEEMMRFVQERKQNPRNDLMSELISCRNPELSDEVLMWLGITLFVGGFKNPGALISNMLLHLGEGRNLRQRLVDDRNLIPKALNEFLRYYSPGVTLARNIVEDTELGGVALNKGQRILVVLPGANHDESLFEDGEVFDIDRTNNNRHIAFGSGPHFCVGFKLANLMFEKLLNEIFDRMPNYTVDADNAVRVDDAGIQAGYITIPATTGLSRAAA